MYLIPVNCILKRKRTVEVERRHYYVAPAFYFMD